GGRCGCAGAFGSDDRRGAIDPLLHVGRPKFGDLRVCRSRGHTGKGDAEVGAQWFEERVEAIAPGTCGLSGVVLGATPEPGVRFRDDPFEQREQHRVLRWEVEVEGRAGDPRALGQVIDGDLGERAVLQQPLQGGENGQLTVVPRRTGGTTTAGGARLADGGHEVRLYAMSNSSTHR